MSLFGFFGFALFMSALDLLGDDNTRPFTRFVFVSGLLLELGLTIPSVAHFANSAVSSLNIYVWHSIPI